MTKYVALLRGVNVGRAKRVGMEDLRAVVTDLGFSDVRTLLNSGNVVFSASRRLAKNTSTRLQGALLERTGVSSRMTLLSGEEVRAMFEQCPLLTVAGDPARLLVAVPSSPSETERLKPLEKRDWAPEALAIGPRVAYLWCPDGLIASPLAQAVGKELGDSVTTRNWTTVTKIVDALRDRTV